MTQDEIIEMARQAGFDTDLQVFKDGTAIAITLAKLVAEKEREACWQIACDYTQKFSSHTCLAIADEIRARGQA